MCDVSLDNHRYNDHDPHWDVGREVWKFLKMLKKNKICSKTFIIC